MDLLWLLALLPLFLLVPSLIPAERKPAAARS
jgi:hypothetical protein